MTAPAGSHSSKIVAEIRGQIDARDPRQQNRPAGLDPPISAFMFAVSTSSCATALRAPRSFPMIEREQRLQ
jgi:hypothetical protein